VLCHTLYDMNGKRANQSRVNARVDAATQQQLDDLILSTGQSISHVVREAIAVYHAQVKTKQRPLPRNLLSMVGKYSSGRSDGATKYKAIIAESLERKYGLSHPRKAKPK
jgi:hypothetical protein